MAVMFDVLCERLEAGFLEQFTESALAIPIRSEVMAVVFAQVLDFGGGVLVVDLPALLAGAAVQSRIFGGITHTNSFCGFWAWRGAASLGSGHSTPGLIAADE